MGRPHQLALAGLAGLCAVVGVAAQAHGYLVEGGPANLVSLHAFLSDTLLLTGHGFEPPVVTPAWGVLDYASKNTGS